MKTFFVSDVHLGSGEGEAAAAVEQHFLQWLDFVHSQRGRLYLLGDIFDFWFEYKRVIPTKHIAVLSRLRRMVDDGIEIHFFKGNHDMWLRSYLSDEIGLIVHDRSEVVEIDGEQVMLGHGHDLCFRRSLTTRLLWILFHEPFFYNLFSTIIHPNLMMRIGELWSKSSRAQKSVSHTFRGDDEYITRYLNDNLDTYRTQNVTKFIFGHFHCPTLHTLSDGQSQLLILGEWSSAPLYGTLENGKLEII